MARGSSRRNEGTVKVAVINKAKMSGDRRSAKSMLMKSTQNLFSDSAAADDAAADRIDPASPVWHRFLDEFRNNPTERKVRGLTELVALVDASNDVSTEPIVAPLGGIVDRAVRLAVPVAGRRAAIVVNVPKTAGVRNRGTALEGLLAALIVDLAAARAECDLAAAAGRGSCSVRSHEVGRERYAF